MAKDECKLMSASEGWWMFSISVLQYFHIFERFQNQLQGELLGQAIPPAICTFLVSLPSWIIISCFFSGEDPLVDDQNERDINSVAGVLKLYFRGLENPLFPKERFQDLISTISKYFPGGMVEWSIPWHIFIEVVRWAHHYVGRRDTERSSIVLVLIELKT